MSQQQQHLLQEAATPPPLERTKRCSNCGEDVPARVVLKNNQNQGRWFYNCNSCKGLFCWGDYRPGVSDLSHANASQIFNSQPDPEGRALAYTMSFDKVLSGEQYAPNPEKMTLTLHHVDAQTFGIRTYRYDEDFIDHLKLLNSQLRKWKPEEKLWHCPVQWYTQVLGHMMAAGFPVDEYSRRRLEDRLGIRRASRSARASQQARPLARTLFAEDEGAEEGDAAEEAGPSQQRHATQEANNRPSSKVKVEAAAAAAGAKGSKRQRSQEEDDDTLCVVCLRDERQYAMVPCGHYLYCGTCAPIVARRGTCALCRQRVERHMKIFS